MPGIFPDVLFGGVPYRDMAGSCLNPPNVGNIYCPAPAFTTSCELTALPSDCTARLSPTQVNAIVSEMVCLAERLSPSMVWNCNSLCNLATAMDSFVAGIIPDPVAMVAAICGSGQARQDLAGCLISTEPNNAIIAGTDGRLYVAPFNPIASVASICGSLTARTNLSNCLVSADAGNELVVGSDGRLYAPELTGTAIVDAVCNSPSSRASLSQCLTSSTGGNIITTDGPNGLYLSAAQVVAAICSTIVAHTALVTCLQSSDANNPIISGSDGKFMISPTILVTLLCGNATARTALATCLRSTDANNPIIAGSDGRLYISPVNMVTLIAGNATARTNLSTSLRSATAGNQISVNAGGLYINADTMAGSICSTPTARNTLIACIISTDSGNPIITGSDGRLFWGAQLGVNRILSDATARNNLAAGLISSQAGNAITTGADGRLYTVANPGPQQVVSSICGDTVARNSLASCLISSSPGNSIVTGGDGRLFVASLPFDPDAAATAICGSPTAAATLSACILGSDPQATVAAICGDATARNNLKTCIGLPTTSNDNRIVRTDGATGAIQQSLATLGDDGSITSPATIQGVAGRFISPSGANSLIVGRDDIPTLPGWNGVIYFQARNSSASNVYYSSIISAPTAVTAGNESATLNLQSYLNGVNTNYISLAAGSVNLNQPLNLVAGFTNPGAARTQLGLGTIATQNANAVAITGGTIGSITQLHGLMDNIQFVSTSSNTSQVSPALLLDRNYPTPGQAGAYGSIQFRGTNSVSTTRIYARIQSAVSNGTNGAEESSLSFVIYNAGVGFSALTIAGSQVQINRPLVLSNALGLAYGGTGAVNAAGARTNLGLAIGTDVQAFNQNLQSISGLANAGFLTRTGPGSVYQQRSIAGTANEITVTNGNGMSGDPTVSLPSALTFTGKTVAGGTFNSPTIAAHTFTFPVNTRTSSAGNAAYWQHWGWTGEQPRWSWWVAANSFLQLHALNGAGSQTATSLILSNAGNVQIPNSLTVLGSVSKGSGTFKIDHPLDPENKDLLHGFVEAPEYQNRYRGRVRLVGGQATINLDEFWNMTPGTFKEINQDVWVESLQNQEGFARLRPSEVVDGVFTIYAEDADCTDLVSFAVSTARADYFVKSGMDKNTDENGRLIIEPEKED